MFGWLLEVVNSGVVGNNVSASNKADAVVRAQPNQIGMFFLGVFVGIIIAIIIFTVLHCFFYSDENNNKEDD